MKDHIVCTKVVDREEVAEMCSYYTSTVTSDTVGIDDIWNLRMGGQQSSIPGGGSEGYHVLRVQDNSPGYNAGLEPFFDFIVAIGNTRLDQDNETFKDLLKANINKHMQMTIYSSKTQQLREISIMPINPQPPPPTPPRDFNNTKLTPVNFFLGEAQRL
eukprot:sb/3472962/